MQKGMQTFSVGLKHSIPCSPAPTVSHPAARNRGGSISSWAQRTIQRRKAALAAYDALRAKGLTAAQAARELGVSPQSLWRWRRRIEPLTDLCGRKSTLQKLCVPRETILFVQRLQLGGRTNAEAWRAVASEAICPAAVSAFLRASQTLPPSLLNASRLRRQKVTRLEGEQFSLIIEPAKSL